MRSIYRDTITVYNRRFVAIVQPPFPPGMGQVRWDRTVIKGAKFRNNTQINQTSEGASEIGHTVSVTIPAGADQGGKTYVGPNEYAGLPQSDHSHWTIRTDIANPDFIILGEGREIGPLYTIADLEREFGDRRIARPRAVRGSEENGILQWKVTGV